MTARRDGRSPISPAEIDWTRGSAPRAPAFGDLYYSDDGGIAETEHVFLQGNDLPGRFDRDGSFAIGELGFGTGLNFLIALKAWRAAAKPPTARLTFVSTEKHPLRPEDHARALAQYEGLRSEADWLLSRAAALHPGPHLIDFPEAQARLILLYGEASETLARIEGRIDAWFLDGFAPARNPAMWSDAVLDQIARLSALGTSFATYTAAGVVRRGLAERGFAVEKRPGFGRKRDMLAGEFEGPHPARGGPARAPWFGAHGAAALAPGARIAIIGAGIAGAALAFHLRAAGFAPTVFDATGPAAGASGSAAGLISPRLSLGDQPSERFHTDAFLYATRLYAKIAPKAFAQTGLLQLIIDDKDHARAEQLIAAAALPSDHLSLVDAATASEFAGVSIDRPALHVARGGAVGAPALVAALLGDAEVRRVRIEQVETTGEAARLYSESGELAFEGDAVVIANALDAARLRPTAGLPLAGSLGQITRFTDETPLKLPVAWGPYAAPAPRDGLVIGATYDPFDGGPVTADAARDARNRAAVGERLSTLNLKGGVGRASVRCVTPDRVPVAGPLPDWEAAAQAYAGLAVGRMDDAPPLPLQPRLWSLAGLGSRGLVTAPLAAALIAADMAGAPSPVERDIAEALHPARFLIRDIKRSRVPSGAQII